MELEPDGEYSSSFFDDYDDEDEDFDSDSDYEDSEEEFNNGEEEFDENTLLKIAGLLNSDDVPSRQSLFSPAGIVGDYADELEEFDTSSEEDEAATRAPQAPIRLPIPPLNFLPKPSSPSGNNIIEEDAVLDDSEMFQQRMMEDSDEEIVIEMEDELVFEMVPSDKPTGMWTLREPELNLPYTTGMFSVANTPSAIRGTELSPQTVGFVRTPRASSSALPQLSSLDLWSGDKAITEDKMWMSAPAVTDARIAAPVHTMWTIPSPEVEETINNGLFTIPTKSLTKRETTMEPATVGVFYKPRVYQSSLPVLVSTGLWNAAQRFPSEHHWITESSISPPSPSMYSPSPLTGTTSASSDRSSYDLFDAASVKTTSTKASSVWASMSSMIPTWREPLSSRKHTSPTLPVPDFRKSALSPSDALAARAAELNASIPKLRRQKSREACKKLQEKSSNLVDDAQSDDETSKKAQGMEFMSIRGSLKPAARRPTKPIAKPAYQRIRSSEADWDAALSEAIAAGPKAVARPKVSKDDWIAELNNKATIVGPVNPKQERPFVTEVEWVTALNEAVSAGTLHRPKRPTVSKENWIAELNQKAIIIGPAFPKKVRTVATEADWAAALEEAISKSIVIVKTPVMSLWGASSSVLVASPTKLWSKSSVPNQTAPVQVFDISIPNIRKAVPAENVEFSILQSTELWKPTHTLLKQVDWILSQPAKSSSPVAVSSLVSPKTWTARTSSATQVVSPTKLWSKESVSKAIASVQEFNISIPNIRKALPAEKPEFCVLESTELWQPTQVISKSVNWISSQPTKSISSPASTQTWRARSKSSAPPPLASDLWSTPTSSPLASPLNMFAHIKSAPAKKATPSRLITLQQLNSTELFTPIPEVDRPLRTHWLLRSGTQVIKPVVKRPLPLKRKLPMSKTWSTSVQPSALNEDISKMWTPRSEAIEEDEEVAGFNTINEPWTRKQRSATTNTTTFQLQDSSLWLHNAEVVNSPKNWLLTKPAMVEVVSKLWIAQPKTINEEETITGFNTINEPWIHKQRNNTTTATFQLQTSDLWLPSIEEMSSPRNWIAHVE